MKTLNFFGKEATLTNFTHYEEYEIIFKFTDEVVKFYATVKPNCSVVNFGLDPFNSNAYGEFEMNGITYILNAPHQASNGDNNWYEYPELSNRIATITVLN